MEGHRLVLSHSNFPQLPPASSLETHDTRTLQLIESDSLGVRPGSLTWAVRHRRSWWACFAYYNDKGTLPGFDQRSTYVGEFDDRWQMRRSWLFPPEFIATWGESSSSGGDWGDDGLLYATGHDAPELHVLRLPRQGVVLEHVATIDVPVRGSGLGLGSQRSRRADHLRHQPRSQGSGRRTHPGSARGTAVSTPSLSSTTYVGYPSFSVLREAR